jgi:hypothetical protein
VRECWGKEFSRLLDPHYTVSGVSISEVAHPSGLLGNGPRKSVEVAPGSGPARAMADPYPNWDFAAIASDELGSQHLGDAQFAHATQIYCWASSSRARPRYRQSTLTLGVLLTLPNVGKVRPSLRCRFRMAPSARVMLAGSACASGSRGSGCYGCRIALAQFGWKPRRAAAEGHRHEPLGGKGGARLGRGAWYRR